MSAAGHRLLQAPPSSAGSALAKRRRLRSAGRLARHADKYVMSYNLLNEGHLDHNDTSMCLAVFVERYPGQARWWNFYFPRLGPRGTVIKLCSGTIIGWDGREVLHCTGMHPDGPGHGNELLGYWIGAR